MINLYKLILHNEWNRFATDSYSFYELNLLNIHILRYFVKSKLVIYFVLYNLIMKMFCSALNMDCT